MELGTALLLIAILYWLVQSPGFRVFFGLLCVVCAVFFWFAVQPEDWKREFWGNPPARTLSYSPPPSIEKPTWENGGIAKKYPWIMGTPVDLGPGANARPDGYTP